MSKHQEWKMIHLLYRKSRRTADGKHSVLTGDELKRAGVHCEADSWDDLSLSGIVKRIVKRTGHVFELSDPARNMIGRFLIAKGPETDFDLRVDYPEVFVIMPFSEIWSDDVFKKMFKPGIKDAKFKVSRGDLIVRIGELSKNVWQSITQAGVIVAEVSVPNPNVYYEIGLAAALGKPIFVFKQQSVNLPADFGGEHYYAYDLNDLGAGRKMLADGLKKWAAHRDYQPFGVKELEDS